MIKKCLFPAAGYGTRFLPATKAMPKEMLPVVNKPLIQYGVEEALEAGLNQIAIVTGRGKRALEDHFDISYELEHQIRNTDKERYLSGIRRLIDSCSFSYTRQIEMRGLGHAILSGRPLIGDEPFAVVLADDLCLNTEGDGVLARWCASTTSSAAPSWPSRKSRRRRRPSTASSLARPFATTSIGSVAWWRSLGRKMRRRIWRSSVAISSLRTSSS